MKKQKKQELYFESDNQGNERRISQKLEIQEERGDTLRPQEINQFTAVEILDLFFDSARIQELLNLDEANRVIRTNFIWKVHNILGEIVMYVEKYLEDNQRLINCLPFQPRQIQRITYSIIEKAQQVPQGEDFLKIKTNIDRIYKHQDCEISKVIVLYSEFTKLSRETFKFEMDLNFQTIQDQIKRKQNQCKGGANFSAEISQQYGNAKGAASKGGQQQASQGGSYPQKLAGTINSRKDVETIPINDDPDKGCNRKWSPTEQANFCKIYSQTDSAVVCAQLMQKQLGPDSRWRTPTQIQNKMFNLVLKVFQKFSSLNTNNEAIKIFKENKEIAMNCEPNIRKKIFRNIAIIYESMLNVSEQKKAIISQKILEVNRLCKDAAHMS